jgi:hypothetical protein
MKIKLLRSVAIAGDHCEAGSIKDVSTADAHILFSIRAAVPFEEIETAAIQFQAKESASIATNKSRRTKR